MTEVQSKEKASFTASSENVESRYRPENVQREAYGETTVAAGSSGVEIQKQRGSGVSDLMHATTDEIYKISLENSKWLFLNDDKIIFMDSLECVIRNVVSDCIFFIIPCIDTYCKVDLRTVSFDVPPQEILSKDSVTVAVDAVVYYRISNATIAVSNVEDYGHSTRLLAATTLRNVLGTKNLSEILSERESISHVMQSSLDEATDPWGVKVERVEIKDVRLPVQLQRAMAAEAEAAREARAKVIAAEGEQRASRALKEAAEVIADSPSALQLRYLQTLNSIAAEKNSTIVFPLPMELFRALLAHVIVQHHHDVQYSDCYAESYIIAML
ncbi:Mechanosensory protein 2 like protein [Argiope bruennichi]|uniref:Mechanosensory protein 2 like protein n=1 Tax=Argiope bruennichi TaxID=94029 RepID=A0A8T0FCY3_ARGBR|nr:Mechanosensory protein 2 like protein [Argiope bruennichi]